MPTSALRPRGFRALQSFCSQDLGSQSWLASSPFALTYRGPWGFQSQRVLPTNQRKQPSSRALQRHLGVLTSRALPIYPRPTSTVSRSPPAPRVSFLALQHIRNRGPISSRPFRTSVPRTCRALEMSRLQGLATLWALDQVPNPLEAYFSLQRSWASPFRALSPPR